MVMSISLSQRNNVQKQSSGSQLGSQGYPTKVTFSKMAQYLSVRYESALNQGRPIQWWGLFPSQDIAVSKNGHQDPS